MAPLLTDTEVGKSVIRSIYELSGRDMGWVNTLLEFPFESIFSCKECKNLQRLTSALLKRGDVGGVKALRYAVRMKESDIEELENRLKLVLDLFGLRAPSKTQAFKVARALLAFPYLGNHTKKYYYLGPALSVLDKHGRRKLINYAIHGKKIRHGRPIGFFPHNGWVVSTGELLKELHSLEKIHTCHSPHGTYGRTVVHSLVHGGGDKDHISIIVFEGPRRKLYRLTALGRSNELIVVSDLHGKPYPVPLAGANQKIPDFIYLLKGLSKETNTVIYLPGWGLPVKVNPPHPFYDTYLVESPGGRYHVRVRPV